MSTTITRRVGTLLMALIVCLSLAFACFPQAQAQGMDGSRLAATSSDVEGEVDLATESLSASSAPSYSGVGLSTRANVQGSGWNSWSKLKLLGDKSGKRLKAIALKLTGLEGLSGHIKYQIYKRGSGWQPAVYDGKSSGGAKNLEAVKIKLTGEVAQHYDVLYRAYVTGKGWRPWVKNNGTAGIVNQNRRVLAIQVKLSPKTEEAYGSSTAKAGVLYAARFKKSGWQKWMRDGKKAGKASRQLSRFAVRVDAGTSEGGVQYRAYNSKKSWTDWKADGASASLGSKQLEAMQIKLTGKLAKEYDVYYRAFVQKVGWLDWASNGATAGSTGYGLRLGAFQVRLVKKGSAAPGVTGYPTVNLMEKTKTMDGIDISSWQAGINLAKVNANFAVIKATGGTKYTNPYYKQWADTALKSGKQIGFYHFARETSSPGTAVKEAKHFIKAVKPYIGKAVLVLDFEADALAMKNPVKWAKKFMDTVYKKTGVKPLIYMSQSVTHRFNWKKVAKKYKLWVAQYLYRNMHTGYISPAGGTDLGYWKSAQMYQYSSTGKVSGYKGSLDLNKFYGSVLTWKRLAKKS